MPESQKTSVAAEAQFELALSTTARALLTPDEIYGMANERILREFREDRRLENKSASIHTKELGEYFSMWANTSPAGGLIVVGIRNDTVFEGCSSLSPTNLNRLEATAEEHCPDAPYESRRILIHRDGDGAEDFVVVFRVKYHPSKVVRTTNGKVYTRFADRLKQLRTPEEISQLKEQKGEVSFELQPSGLEYPTAFDMNAIQEFTATVRQEKGWAFHHTPEGILELMHLGTRDGERFVANVACALLFANDPRTLVPGARIHFTRFEGEKVEVGRRWNAVRDVFIDGTIPRQIEAAAVELASQLRTFTRLDKSRRFTPVPEYPEFAWYEAIVNACAHRSYGDGMKNLPIFIRMFDNKLEFESPGPFPAFVNPNNIEVHHPRNPFLMDALYYMRFVRMAHEGVRRMKAEMAGMDLPLPEFSQPEQAHTVVRVTLKNNIKQRRVWVDSDVSVILGKQVAAGLTEDEIRCINHIAEYGSINATHAQRLTGRAWETMDRMLRRLVEKGILRREARSDIQRDPNARFVLARPIQTSTDAL